MQYEKSCGAVVVDTTGDRYKYLCVLQGAGHWSLPKGHMGEDDDEREAAVLQTKKETGLEVELVGEFVAESRYAPRPDVMKTVKFFLAKPIGGVLCPSMESTQACEWLHLEDAKKRLAYQDTQDILDEADAYLKDLD